ncbi:MAG: hypothetical protein WCQ23_02765 [Candidatus Methanomethylophilaceae archaeon]
MDDNTRRIVGGMSKAVDLFMTAHNYGRAWRELTDIRNSMEDDIANYCDTPNRIKTSACLRSVPSQLSLDRSGYHVHKKIKLEKGNICTDKNGIDRYPLFASAFFDEMQ